MPAPDQTNPFAGLMTSEALKQQRLAQVMQYAGNDPNQAMAAKGIFDFTESLRAAGHGLTKEDYRARRNDAIVQTAAEKMNSRVNDGVMDPEDAMAQTLEESYQQFLKAGDIESAGVIAPHIFAARQQQGELAKLKADTNYLNARPELEAAKAETAAAKAETAAERARTQERLDLARADLADRTDPNLRGRGGVGGNTTKTYTSKFRAQGAAIVGLVQNLGDLLDIYKNQPGVASQPASLISRIQDSVKGSVALVAPENKEYNYGQAEQYLKTNDKRIQGLGKVLNVDRGILDSTLIDTAYTLARARDPGGRISNADFDNALKLLGAARDPNQAKAVIIDLGRRSVRDFQNQARSNPDFAGEPVIDQAEEAWQGLLQRGSGKAPAPRKTADQTVPATGVAAPPTDFSKLSDEELQRIANGG